jgi:ubiquinone/menaquinone biosynthesis C-methylase UbiE
MTSSQSAGPSGGEQRLFSQASFAEIYEEALVGPLFDPWVAALLDDAELKPPARVLDVACGTGIVARRAKERLGAKGSVVGIDLNPQMLAVARRQAPEVDWREGNAGALPLRDGEAFDVALCQQGFQFFPDRAAAARQMHRALRKGGRAAVSTWRPDTEFPVLHELRGIAERHIGHVDDRRHSLGEPGPLEAVLRDAGFHDVRSKRYARQIRFRDGSVFARLNATALISMSAQAGALDNEARQRVIETIVRDSAELVGRNTDEAGFSFEIGTNVVVAAA